MKKIMLFYLETCPYCKNAYKAMEELIKENVRYILSFTNRYTPN